MKSDPELHARWLRERELCRTNLYYLCGVLGYKDVKPEVHGDIVGNCQKLPGGVDLTGDFITLKRLAECYEPRKPIWALEGKRDALTLVSRGFLKSSIVTIAHSIQWNINYPDIAIGIVSAIGDQAEGFLKEIKGHYQTNERFRWLFPEFVPHKNPQEFGAADRFTCPNRTAPRKESTFFCLTLTSVIAGWHPDVLFIDDLVDKENVKTAGQIQTVNDFLRDLDPLIRRWNKPEDWPSDKPFHNKGWTFLTGTIYSFSDPHYKILDHQRRLPSAERQWRICLKSAARNYPSGPAAWPERYPMEELKKIEMDPARGPGVLWPQYLMKPLTDSQGLIDSKDQLESLRTPKLEIGMIFPRLQRAVTVDIGGLEKQKLDNDDSVINYHGFGTDGRLYILELQAGKWRPQELIDRIFALYKRDPLITEIKISEDALARMLMPFLKAEMSNRGIRLPLKGLKIDNQTSKETKIKGLQPHIVNDSIRFSAEITGEVWHKLVQQALFFPKYVHDDIWDTIADAFFNRDGTVTSKVQRTGRQMPKHRVVEEFGAPARVDPNDPTHLLFESCQPQPVAQQIFEQSEPIMQYDDMTGY